MTEERMANVAKLKALLGIMDEDKDALTEFALENAEEIIKNYCHIDTIPEGLSTTLLRMAADVYRTEQYGGGEAPAVIKSITEGDTSTSYDTAETAAYAESVLKNYKAQLRRYRRVVF